MDEQGHPPDPGDEADADPMLDGGGFEDHTDLFDPDDRGWGIMGTFLASDAAGERSPVPPDEDVGAPWELAETLGHLDPDDLIARDDLDFIRERLFRAPSEPVDEATRATMINRVFE